MWTGALVSAVLGTRLPGPGTIYLAQDLRFHKPVAPGDTICIPPGTPHCIEADAGGSLRMLCCCSPAYTHADTWILGPEQQEPQ